MFLSVPGVVAWFRNLRSECMLPLAILWKGDLSVTCCFLVVVPHVFLRQVYEINYLFLRRAYNLEKRVTLHPNLFLKLLFIIQKAYSCMNTSQLVLK